MSNAIARTKYQIIWKPTRDGITWSTPTPTTITKQQYETISPLLNDYKFLTIGSDTVATDQIAKIEQVIIEPSDWYMKMNGQTFYSEEEFNNYLQ